MHQVLIKFKNAEQVKVFINKIDKFETRFDLGSDHKTVNAKSILGILALDLSKPLQLRYDSDDSRIGEMIAPYMLAKEKAEA